MANLFIFRLSFLIPLILLPITKSFSQVSQDIETSIQKNQNSSMEEEKTKFPSNLLPQKEFIIRVSTSGYLLKNLKISENDKIYKSQFLFSYKDSLGNTLKIFSPENGILEFASSKLRSVNNKIESGDILLRIRKTNIIKNVKQLPAKSDILATFFILLLSMFFLIKYYL